MELHLQVKDCHLYEKSGDKFPSQAEYRETADTELCGHPWAVPICWLCSCALSQDSVTGVCGRWADQLLGTSISPSSALIPSAPQMTPQCGQEHLEAGTVIAAEFLRQEAAGLCTQHWSHKHQSVINPYLGGHWDSRADCAAWLALFVMLIVIHSYCQYQINSSCNSAHHDRFCGRLQCFLSWCLKTFRVSLHSSLWQMMNPAILCQNFAAFLFKLSEIVRKCFKCVRSKANLDCEIVLSLHHPDILR